MTQYGSSEVMLKNWGTELEAERLIVSQPHVLNATGAQRFAVTPGIGTEATCSQGEIPYHHEDLTERIGWLQCNFSFSFMIP